MPANTTGAPAAGTKMDHTIGAVIELMRANRMPHAREIAQELLTTAKAQRWDPAEAVRVLLEAEATGRNKSMLDTRRKRAGFPSGKTFEIWDSTLSASRPQPPITSVPWNGCAARKT